MSDKTAIENLYHMLRERDVECETYELPDEGMAVSWMGDHDIEWEATAQGENFAIHALQLVTPEQAIAATVGKDIERYDGSGRRGTVAILQGGRKPEEVLFVHDEGGVTHYLPEGAGTCKNLSEYSNYFHCSECGYEYDFLSDNPPKHCPNCGKQIEVSE